MPELLRRSAQGSARQNTSLAGEAVGKARPVRLRNEVAKLLVAAGYQITAQRRLRNNLAVQLRLTTGQVVNIYDTGSVVVQGVDPASVERVLQRFVGESRSRLTVVAKLRPSQIRWAYTMTCNVEKVDDAPIPLPASAWRITADLQTAIERCLTETGHQILSSRFPEDYRNWQLQLLLGQTVDVSVDCHISPGTLKIVVRGDDTKPVQTLLDRYRRIPILKITVALSAGELLSKPPPMMDRSEPWPRSKQLKFAIRRRITGAGCRTARYKIVQEVHGANWIICLNTAQQLEIKGCGKLLEGGLTIAGFGTDLDRLQRLMAVFDVGHE